MVKNYAVSVNWCLWGSSLRFMTSLTPESWLSFQFQAWFLYYWAGLKSNQIPFRCLQNVVLLWFGEFFITCNKQYFSMSSLLKVQIFKPIFNKIIYDGLYILFLRLYFDGRPSSLFKHLKHEMLRHLFRLFVCLFVFDTVL